MLRAMRARLRGRMVGSLCLALVGLLLSGCERTDEEGLTVVASLYPLAWAAEIIGGAGVEVIDLTPPGVEAHDATLTAEQRAELERAEAVVLLGVEGFQPEIERAAGERSEGVFEVLGTGPQPEGVPADDPHVWLDPVRMASIVEEVADALETVEGSGGDGFRSRAAGLVADLESLHEDAAEALTGCRYDTLIVTHDAFGYLAARYGFEQLGLTGLTPEAEPSGERLEAAGEAARLGRAGAVFYELTDEGERVGRGVAEDLGVPALPLSTLESAPEEGDYRSVMRSNLEALQSGMGCA
jgi:zinc transport system substrate-binding protein